MNRDTSVLLKLEDIAIRFDGQRVLDGVDLTLRRGEIVTLVGPNGAGKSTLVRVVTGLLKPDRGRLLYSGSARPAVGYMPQRLRLDSSMPLKVSRFLSLTGRRQPTRAERLAALEKVGVAHLNQAQVHQLSGGELQRVLLARAILRKPDLLVLDEPLQGVDVGGQTELYRLIASLRDDLGCGILMVSHDLHLVMARTDTVICLNRHICCHGRPESVSKDPEYIRLFGRKVAEDLAIYTHHHDHHHDIHGDVVDHQCEHHHD